ncbi:MAG TPA: spermidine synthase, partial [Candidatus Polarisedimenticolia bacterium]|nr:spermidine synthase [Candidatus Polarisedimenticolia bacterium]
VFHDLIYVPVTGWAYDSLFPALGSGFAVGAAKWGLAGLLILPQSILLGATFPLMSAGIIRRAPERPGSVLSILYFTNSLGAAAGVLIAGFVLVRAAGLPGTLLAAAIVNLVVGLAAFFVAKLHPPAEAGEAAPARTAVTRFENDASLMALPMLTRLLLIAALGTAIASFVYEVAWIRLLSLVLGSATHSFELMLSAFILGLSLGAFWIRRRMETMTRPLAVLVNIQMVMGGFALLSLAFYQQSFLWTANILTAVGRTDQGYTLYTLARYALCLVIMLPATFCAGMTLPLITRTLFVSGAGEGAIGKVYSWNTFGSIIGAASASLLLIPLLGLKGTLILGGVMDMAVGLLIVWLLSTRGAPVRKLAISSLVLAVGATLAVGFGVRLDRAMLTSGVFRTGRYGIVGEPRYYKDGRTATVSVTMPKSGRLSIGTNGKPDGSLAPAWFKACQPGDSLQALAGDDPTQVLLPLMTLVHRAGARQVAVIGQGTGMSSHSLLASPALESLVTIEIEPVMVEASRAFLPANRRVFDDPRSVHIYNDAKAYFAATNRKFDIIVAEPSNPWVSGVSGLFTREFYSRVKRYLAPGAVLGQWLHTYELTDDLVLTVLGAIHENFSDYRIYSVNAADLLIVAVAEGQVPAPDWGVFQLPEV